MSKTNKGSSSRKHVNKSRKMIGGDLQDVDTLSDLLFNNVKIFGDHKVWIKYLVYDQGRMGGKIVPTDLFKECIGKQNSRGQYILNVMCRFASLNTINILLKFPINYNEIINNRSGPSNSTPAIDCAYSNRSLNDKVKILKLLQDKGADLTLKNTDKPANDIIPFLTETMKMELGINYNEKFIDISNPMIKED